MKSFIKTWEGEAVTSSTKKWSLQAAYEAHGPGCFRFAFLLTQDSELAADLTQDAFVRFARGFGYLRKQDAAGAYLRRTVLNLARSHFRRLANERQVMSTIGGPGAIDDDSNAHALREDLWAALARLPVRQRAALVLRYYEDLAENEVADILRISPRAVNSLVARGRDQLRRGGHL